MMRAPIILTSLLLLGNIILNSCQKEYVDPLDTPTTSDFTAKISGVPFVADITNATKTNGIIYLAGKSNDGQMIAFSVTDSGAHVYSLEINNISNLGSYLSSTGSIFFSNEGTIPGESGGNLAIASMDTVQRLISGTFNLKVFRQADSTQKIITEGVFKNISY
jgi:hypothetical protein